MSPHNRSRSLFHDFGTQFCPISRACLFALVIFFIAQNLSAQTEPVEGLRDNSPRVHALVGARLVTEPGKVIDNGTIVIRDGLISEVGADTKPPSDARIWSYEGKTIYAGFIESYSHLGLPKESGGSSEGSASEEKGKQEATNAISHWNKLMRADRSVLEEIGPAKSAGKTLRDLGFCAALVAPQDGIFRGTSVLINLDDGELRERIVSPRVSQHLGLEWAGWRDRLYPNSLLGAIAFMRQTFLDTDWYHRAQAAYQKNLSQPAPESNAGLAALLSAAKGQEPVIIEATNELNFLRAAKIASEFNLNMIIHGSGYEYRLIDQIRKTGLPVILPVAFPDAPSVEDPAEALDVSLAEMQHWEFAPSNPAWLHQKGVAFALTTSKLKKSSEFHQQVRTAIERGLPAKAALAAITTVPAQLLNVGDKLGSIASGKIANLVVTEGELFEADSKIIDTWIAGRRYQVHEPPAVDLRGEWKLTLRSRPERERHFVLKIKGSPEKPKGTLVHDSTETKLKSLRWNRDELVIAFAGDSLGLAGIIRLAGVFEKDNGKGNGVLADGSEVKWTALRQSAFEEPQEESETAEDEDSSQRIALPAEYPFGGFGRKAPPVQPKHLLVKNATVWTCSDAGKLEDADLLVTSGKINKVGQGLTAPEGAVMIDAAGKHVTPGLIDAHSHSAANSINESGQAVTAEVRISDVLNSSDHRIYQQLAGGLTVSHIMHGSANPIGGQNQTIKLRWGLDTEGLKFKEAVPTIKFALGENVKRSNVSRPSSRYPQTRMGVEQLIRDRFQAAKEYEQEWARYRNRKSKEGFIPPRRDLELDALLEILRGERLIHCHSYRQDEILMLIRVAEEFGFTVGTFQHVLEGYKIAEAIAAHGAHASTFSDWWAYKFEVYDAIPYNGAMMHRQGVVTSFNSDSGELARRMNLEAAKAVKYGGLPEEEALLFVTLNAAKQLNVDHLVGSLESGKHADFVIWSGPPLSTSTVCEQTWIEGRKYFDREEDEQLRQEALRERARLVQEILSAGDRGKKSKSDSATPSTRDHDSHHLRLDDTSCMIDHGHGKGNEF